MVTKIGKLVGDGSHGLWNHPSNSLSLNVETISQQLQLDTTPCTAHYTMQMRSFLLVTMIELGYKLRAPLMEKILPQRQVLQVYIEERC